MQARDPNWIYIQGQTMGNTPFQEEFQKEESIQKTIK